MKWLILFFSLGLVHSGQAQRQFKWPGQNLRVLLLDTDATLTLGTTHSDTVELSAQYSESGKTYGFSNTNERTPFHVTHSISGDTLRISHTRIEKLHSVGISTYRDKVKLTLLIPHNQASTITVRNKGLTEGRLAVSGLASVRLNSPKVIVNNLKRGLNFESISTGKANLTIFSDAIRLILD